MWLLLKSELKYSLDAYIPVVVLAFLFSFFLLIGHPFMREEDLTTRIFWPFIVGFMPLLIIVKIWLNNNNIENRLRIQSILPLPIKHISIVRILSGRIALILLVVYYLIIHSERFLEWQSIVIRLFYILGSICLIITILLLTFDLHLVYNTNITVPIFVMGLLIFATISIIGITVGQFIFNKMDLGIGMGMIFPLMAFVVLLIDKYIFQKRQTYLI